MKLHAWPSKADPLLDEIRALVHRAGARETGAYARLVKLGLTHCRPLTGEAIKAFGEQLKRAALAAPRVSEIKAILSAAHVARRFTTTRVGIRLALRQARLGSARNRSATANRPARARAQIARAAEHLICLMRAHARYSVNCGLFQVRYDHRRRPAGPGEAEVTARSIPAPHP